MGNWIEGKVDVEDDHIKITYRGNPNVIALVANSDEKIVVQFLDESPRNKNEKEAVLRELNFYFNELHNEDPWDYAIYHTQTSSNEYSSVHWDFFPKGYSG